jgi:hypothetical protein
MSVHFKIFDQNRIQNFKITRPTKFDEVINIEKISKPLEKRRASPWALARGMRLLVRLYHGAKKMRLQVSNSRPHI